jgi:type IV pilus assembly protein PilX
MGGRAVKSQIKQQRGVALIVSLVILVLVTVAGVATMESTGMQLKMANASRDRQEAFEATETALRLVEQTIDDNTDDLAEIENMYLECSGSDCYTPNCGAGRCFQGLWRDGDPVEQCKIVDDAAAHGGTVTVAVPTTEPWQTGSGSDFLNVWETGDRHATLDVDAYDNPVRYIVEFRCFTAADPEVPLDDTNFAQLFRITARGMSNSGRVEVMLQSTYKRTE